MPWPWQQNQAQAPLVPLTDPGARAAQAAAFNMTNPQVQQQQAQQNNSSASLQRLTTPPSSDVYVTVPVDKITVKGGMGAVTPLYSTGKGYQQAGKVPPTPMAGRP